MTTTTTTTSLGAAATAGLAARSGTYAIDPAASRIGFTVRSLAGKVRGSFTELEGSGRLDAEHPARSSIALRLGASSVDTGNHRRDAHLRSDDFLAAGAHPHITFASTAVEALGDEQYRVTGDLSIRGVTRPVTVEVRHTGVGAGGRMEFEGRAVLSRKQWGVRWSRVLEAGGLLIGDKVAVDLAVSVVPT